MKKKILIAPLNWGLGHATRCIPIINALLTHGFTPIIASDGAALALLIKEFPELLAVELPSYNIHYSKTGRALKYKLLNNAPTILKAIRAEQKMVRQLVEEHQIDGLISDNRFGVYHNALPSVYITHQLRVLSGSTTWLSTKLHEFYIKRFQECWVPDSPGIPNLSGKMGHKNHTMPKVKYLGPLSRFEKKPGPLLYEVMILLSGPEPQRSQLEKIVRNEFKDYQGRVLLVRGVIEPKQQAVTSGNLTVYNFMTSSLLEKSLNASQLIISRSGYTTLMDLAKLEKEAFFIPTPGQFEQLYLAKEMTKNKWAASCMQKDFSIAKLSNLTAYSGLKAISHKPDFKILFQLFERK